MIDDEDAEYILAEQHGCGRLRAEATSRERRKRRKDGGYNGIAGDGESWPNCPDGHDNHAMPFHGFHRLAVDIEDWGRETDQQ